MRTDIHRPAEFDPEQYTWVGGFDNSPAPGSFMGDPQTYTMDDGTEQIGTNWLNAEYRWLRGLVEVSKTAAYGTCWQCDHCGARIRYVGVFRHGPTGDHIAVGETCAEGRFTYDKATFDRLRKQAQLDREAQKILQGWNTYRAEHAADWEALDASTNDFVKDVLRKGRLYGTLSERQLAAIVKVIDREAEKVNQADAPEEVKVDAPAGRQTFTGTVVGRKLHEGYYGSQLKMTVKVTTPEGIWLCWVTVPTNVDVERGDTVTLTANLTVSDRDPAFAFGKRPTKVTVQPAPKIELVEVAQ
jgi:hypothetical protein